MRYVVLHKSDKRIRIKTPIINMSYRQADLLEYYLKSLSWVKDAVVDERTCNATIIFNNVSTLLTVLKSTEAFKNEAINSLSFLRKIMSTLFVHLIIRQTHISIVYVISMEFIF